MSFEQIKKKCPEGWKSFQGCVTKARIEQTDEEYEFLELYGYLVLEFFPSHGIEIERSHYCDIKGDKQYNYFIYRHDSHEGNTRDSLSFPEEAITEAFEILERKG